MMRKGMIRKSISMLLFSGLLVMCTGCCIHLWPEEDDINKPDELRKVTIRLEYAPDLYIWDHTYDPISGAIRQNYPDADIFEGYPGTTSTYSPVPDKGKMEILLMAIPQISDTKGGAEFTFIKEIDGNYDTDLDIELPLGVSYTIVVWSHLIENEKDGAYYDASDFNSIKLVREKYTGNTDFRDGYRGIIDIGSAENRSESYTLKMRRPMGKFELVTTDLSEFLERETVRRNLPRRAESSEYMVVFSFPMYYPCSYSAPDDRLENADGGFHFTTRMTVTGESEASLGFEYVFINDIRDAGVQMRVDIYDPEGVHVAGSSTLTVPLRRDVHTLLHGTFLSLEGEGGVGLDPSYDGNHNVIW